MKIKYSSNNSGGYWWLKDEDWHALEKAGWDVEWAKDEKDGLGYLDSDGRWLGALAKRASKNFETPRDAILEFEEITGEDASSEGCNCCGPPHSFSWEGEYASGDEILVILYGESPTKRQLLERSHKED